MLVYHSVNQFVFVGWVCCRSSYINQLSKIVKCFATVGNLQWKYFETDVCVCVLFVEIHTIYYNYTDYICSPETLDR